LNWRRHWCTTRPVLKRLWRPRLTISSSSSSCSSSRPSNGSSNACLYGRSMLD
jgi:hypothetical protein